MLRSLLRLLTVQTVPHDLAPTTASRCRRTHPGRFPAINTVRECRGAPDFVPSNAKRSQRWLRGTAAVINNRRSWIDVVIVPHDPGYNPPRTRLLQSSTNKGIREAGARAAPARIE